MPCMEFPFEETGLTYVFTQKRRKLMFTIISIMFIGIGIGYLMRNVQMLQKVEKSASLTILLLLFVLGVSIGSNRLIVDNLGTFVRVAGTTRQAVFRQIEVDVFGT